MKSEPPTPAAAPRGVRGLHGDMVDVLRQLDVVSVRCLLIDLDSLDFRHAWTITETGGFSRDEAVWSADQDFPGLVTTVSRLSLAPSDETFARRIAARRWVFGWRIEQSLAIVVDARFRVPLGDVSPSDFAMLRLVCGASLPRRQATAMPGGGASHMGDENRSHPAAPATTEGETEPVAPSMSSPNVTDDSGLTAQSSGPDATSHHAVAVEPPAMDSGDRARYTSPLAAKLGLALLVVCGLITFWLAAVAVPGALSAQLSERQKQQERADLTMTRDLAAALATGDYGDVQTVLSSFAALGYFESALVTNARQRVVAQAGPTPATRIGDGVPPEVGASARSLELASGSQRLGEILLLTESTRSDVVSILQAIRVAAALAGVAALAGAVALRRRQRDKRDPAVLP